MGDGGSAKYFLLSPKEGGGKHRTNVYAACSGDVVVVVLGDLVTLEAFCEGLERSTQLFIMNLACKFDTLDFSTVYYKYAYTHTHTLTWPRTYACAWTLAARQSVQSILWGGKWGPCRGGIVPADFVE